MDQTHDLNNAIGYRGGAPSALDAITNKVSEGLHATAGRIHEGIAQLGSSPTGPLASVAPTIRKYGDEAVRAIDKSADYIRDLDLEQLRSDATEKVKKNPGTAILAAAGIGFLLGAVLKRRGV